MVKYFDCSIVDMTQKKIISGSPINKIKDYEVQLDQFRKEIDWWFALYRKTSVLHKFKVKKPIVIEMYEFADYLSKVLNQISNAVHVINKIYISKNRVNPINQIEKTTKKTVSNIKKILNPLRNQIVAHRYKTTRSGTFLRMEDLMKLHSDLAIKNLNKCKKDLYDSHDIIMNWLSNKTNRTKLILAQ